MKSTLFLAIAFGLGLQAQTQPPLRPAAAQPTSPAPTTASGPSETEKSAIKDMIIGAQQIQIQFMTQQTKIKDEITRLSMQYKCQLDDKLNCVSTPNPTDSPGKK